MIKDAFSKLMFSMLKSYKDLMTMIGNNGNDLPFLTERMKTEKVEKLVANLYDKTEYVMHIRNLKQALNRRLVFKKVHKVHKM